MDSSIITIGIVEDDLDVLRYLSRAFQNDTGKMQGVEFRILATDRVEETTHWIEEDLVDVWIVDLVLPNQEHSTASWTVGRNLVRKIHQASSGGIIVYTSESLGDRANELLEIGADDFVRKAEVGSEFGKKVEHMQEYLRSKVIAVWRRVRFSRPRFRSLALHSNSEFRLGIWTFSVQSRILRSNEETIKLTTNEHVVLRHLCVAETHTINTADFVAFVVGQSEETQDVRLKNLIHRLRKKLGDSVAIVTTIQGYRLQSVIQLR